MEYGWSIEMDLELKPNRQVFFFLMSKKWVGGDQRGNSIWV